ncbi:uncharacterized protein TNCV_3015531 [Trichonephila clavipes]|nr:uncharacterized protein TNCV_3015531 [Trichonephila clavipes]
MAWSFSWYLICSLGKEGTKSCWDLLNERADQNKKCQAGSRVVSTERPLDRQKSIIITYIEKYIIVTQNTKSLGKPWETLATEGSIPRHLERAEAVAHFCLTTVYNFLGVYYHWLGLDTGEACRTVTLPRWMTSICSNALDSMNTRVTTSSVGTGRLGGPQVEYRWLRSLESRIDVGAGGDHIDYQRSFQNIFLLPSLESRDGSGQPLYPRVTSVSRAETNALDGMEDDTVREIGYSGINSEVSCDNGSDESFSKQDANS